MKFTTTSLIQYVKSIVEWCSSVMGEGIGTHEDQSHGKGQVHRYFWECYNSKCHYYASLMLAYSFIHMPTLFDGVLIKKQDCVWHMHPDA
jgi:hypothetical protein